MLELGDLALADGRTGERAMFSSNGQMTSQSEEGDPKTSHHIATTAASSNFAPVMEDALLGLGPSPPSAR